MKPRTGCFCQPIFSMISASVAPFFRWSMATTWAVLVPSRGPALSGAFAAFLGALAVFLAVVGFLGAAALAPLALFWLLGATFFGLAAFFEGACSGATGAPCSATAAVSVVLDSAFFMVLILSAVVPRMTIHHSGGPGRQGRSSTFWKKDSMAAIRSYPGCS